MDYNLTDEEMLSLSLNDYAEVNNELDNFIEQLMEEGNGTYQQTTASKGTKPEIGRENYIDEVDEGSTGELWQDLPL